MHSSHTLASYLLTESGLRRQTVHDLCSRDSSGLTWWVMARMGCNVSAFKVLYVLRGQKTDDKWYEGRGEWLVLKATLRRER